MSLSFIIFISSIGILVLSTIELVLYKKVIRVWISKEKIKIKNRKVLSDDLRKIIYSIKIILCVWIGILLSNVFIGVYIGYSIFLYSIIFLSLSIMIFLLGIFIIFEDWYKLVKKHKNLKIEEGER